MRLDINSKYCITSDERQFIVNQKGISGEKSEKPGEETLRPIGYFGTLNSCLKFLVNKQIRDSDCRSFMEVVSLVKSLHDEIDQLCNFDTSKEMENG
ncbi:MAG TPA: replication initiation protein [Desulfitobacterium dehalogenans]|uniref:Replication initiation protein n=1 Tax=Desulfitobacterium dehalogenans TaxID=36854 RepID=A0A7C6Z3V4_9FIRM|nr:replication initiation protein [Desulfitobacterium dehalogenans]